MAINGYQIENCLEEGKIILQSIKDCTNLESARSILYGTVTEIQYERHGKNPNQCSDHKVTIMRDCARAFRSMIAERSDSLSGFSVSKALWDISRGVRRDDLSEGFFAEMIHLFRGLRGFPYAPDPEKSYNDNISGRDAALARSDELDIIWANMESTMKRYHNGLSDESVNRRTARRKEILAALGGSDKDWNDWHWQTRNIITDPDILSSLAKLSEKEHEAVKKAVKARIPFGITPYYASLMDNDPQSGRDMAIRTQVIPTSNYVDLMAAHGENRTSAFDFMLEADTSPIDLVTRRYPAVAILKPFNTCPQICVYCQRNWEIEQAMAPKAMASRKAIEQACSWIKEHPAVKEILITGGDPLAMTDKSLESILDKIAGIDHVEMIRIGTRIPVTIPMRITPKLADMLGCYRRPGKRDVALVTHIEHVYEVTPQMVTAIDLLKRQGISVYNQHVFTFFVSRRFETTALRRLIRICGIESYYTFAPKGKDETADYRVPVARILQEQKEENRLLPGTRRTDEPVYNVPGLGKNYLRAYQHRDLLSVHPDGSRVYEFHPWEKNIMERSSYVGSDIPILTYLSRLEEIGENPVDYSSIWYYF
jgi:lysine 2,3-aminomutase